MNIIKSTKIQITAGTTYEENLYIFSLAQSQNEQCPSRIRLVPDKETPPIPFQPHLNLHHGSIHNVKYIHFK